MMYYIIIRGPLGIGKTTIADKLAKILKGIHVSIDKVLEENGLDRVDDNYIPEDFIKANEIALNNVSKEIENGKVVIFDGNFYFKKQIKHLESSLREFKGYLGMEIYGIGGFYSP